MCSKRLPIGSLAILNSCQLIKEHFYEPKNMIMGKITINPANGCGEYERIDISKRKDNLAKEAYLLEGNKL